jgi:streptomycin 6-kinase
LLRRYEDGSKAILKLGISGAGLLSEIAALKAFNGAGFCKLLDSEHAKGVMLLEYIEPGESLNIVNDEITSTKIVAGLIKDMPAVNPLSGYSFQTADDWCQDLLDLHQRFGNDQVPGHLFKSGIAAYHHIRSDNQVQRLLHGDLHHENILSAENGTWKAIDPKGIIADTACELIPFLMNDLQGKDLPATLSARINVFSEELQMDRASIIRWGTFRSVLSLYWKMEDRIPLITADLLLCEYFANKQL